MTAPCRLSVWEWHTECSPLPRYTDGSEVQAGDAIRYRQAPGGILAASREWRYGTAVVSSHCSGTLDLAATDGRLYHILSHIIEPLCDHCVAEPATVTRDLTAFGDEIPAGMRRTTRLCAECDAYVPAIPEG